MITIIEVRKFVLSFNGVEERPHFDKISFRANKKIFATFSEKENIAMLKLSLVDQSVFCDISGGAIYPVTGNWGKQGATYFDLKNVKMKLFKDAMTCSYNMVTSKK